ncbi:MAG: Gfo/Idh/MocA family protein [Pirellulales bacterium]
MASIESPPLRLALLGADDTTPAIVRAIAASPRLELAGVCELDPQRDEELGRLLAAQFGRVRLFDRWEALLTREHADAVVVARALDEDYRAEQLRKLIQTGVGVLTAHPVLDSMLLYYELDMIRRDTASVVVPYLPERQHPAVRALQEMAAAPADSPLGKIEQVAFERRAPAADKQSVVAQFARDVDVLRAVAGDMTRLGAMAGTQHSESYAGLGVQMSGPAGIVVRWSIDPIHGGRGARMTVLGTRGKALVEIAPEGGAWSMEVTHEGGAQTQRYEDWDPAAAALAQLERALAGAAAEPDWVDAARAVELAETIDRSLRKSRTIELYYEDYTEAGTFKGTMTSVGCGLLLFGLLIMGLVAIGDHLGVPYLSWWPYMLAGGLGVFLLLQLLMLVFQGDDARLSKTSAAAHELPPSSPGGA